MVEARCWLDGSYCQGSGPSFDLRHPATDEIVTQVYCASREDVDKAVESGKRAWPEWFKNGPEVRATCLNKWADLLEEHAEELGKVSLVDVIKSCDYGSNSENIYP
jgi:acyl-CoA reductase-like NAD-dependent aldehyde dehydrogenase